MHDRWYCLVFGMELGPMSWEDLLQRAARGDLQMDSQVRQGDRSRWTNAGDVRGLLPDRQAGAADAPFWYCEILGAELGPMSWSDLCELARRGNLSPDNRVRSQNDDDWSAGADIAGLFAAKPTTATLQSAPAETPKAAKHSRPNEKQAKQRAPRSEVRSRIELPVSRRFLAGVSGLLLLALCVYLAFMAAGWSGTHGYSKPKQIASGYQQLYDELRQARQGRQPAAAYSVNVQFMPRIASLNYQLQEMPPGDAAAKLQQAGAELSNLLAGFSAAPGSAEETAFHESEQRFMTLLEDVKAELAK